MHVWEKTTDLKCVLCKRVPDSHNHLFFECPFSGKIWDEIKIMAKLHKAPDKWSDILSFMLHRPFTKSIWSVLQRLVIGACIYFVWQERNLRTFQDQARSCDVLCKLIKDTVRLRIMGLSINNSLQVFEAANIWDFQVKHIPGMKKVNVSNG